LGALFLATDAAVGWTPGWDVAGDCCRWGGSDGGVVGAVVGPVAVAVVVVVVVGPMASRRR